MFIVQVIDRIGRVVSTTIDATETELFAGTEMVSGQSSRQAVGIKNHDGTNSIFVYLANIGDAEPTVDDDSHIVVVAPDATEWIGVGLGVALWIASSSGTVAYTATELL